ARLSARHWPEAKPPRRRAADRCGTAGALSPLAAVRRDAGRVGSDGPGAGDVAAVPGARRVQRVGPVHGVRQAGRPSGVVAARPAQRPPRPLPRRSGAGARHRLMPTLRRYVARQFGANMVLMLLAFASLLQLFDLLASSDDIIKLHGARV